MTNNNCPTITSGASAAPVAGTNRWVFDPENNICNPPSAEVTWTADVENAATTTDGREEISIATFPYFCPPGYGPVPNIVRLQNTDDKFEWNGQFWKGTSCNGSSYTPCGCPTCEPMSTDGGCVRCTDTVGDTCNSFTSGVGQGTKPCSRQGSIAQPSSCFEWNGQLWNGTDCNGSSLTSCGCPTCEPCDCDNNYVCTSEEIKGDSCCCARPDSRGGDRCTEEGKTCNFGINKSKVRKGWICDGYNYLFRGGVIYIDSPSQCTYSEFLPVIDSGGQYPSLYTGFPSVADNSSVSINNAELRNGNIVRSNGNLLTISTDEYIEKCNNGNIDNLKLPPGEWLTTAKNIKVTGPETDTSDSASDSASGSTKSRKGKYLVQASVPNVSGSSGYITSQIFLDDTNDVMLKVVDGKLQALENINKNIEREETINGKVYINVKNMRPNYSASDNPTFNTWAYSSSLKTETCKPNTVSYDDVSYPLTISSGPNCTSDDKLINDSINQFPTGESLCTVKTGNITCEKSRKGWYPSQYNEVISSFTNDNQMFVCYGDVCNVVSFHHTHTLHRSQHSFSTKSDWLVKYPGASLWILKSDYDTWKSGSIGINEVRLKKENLLP